MVHTKRRKPFRLLLGKYTTTSNSIFLQNWEVLNTAVLTGQQVSQAMKVFIVSQAGKAADVTFQASCHSEDDNVLKVCNLRL